MPDIDFVMTYPCYFLLTQAGNPEALLVDGNKCVCLFTDRDLVESFYKDKYGDDFVSRTIEAFTCNCKDALLNTLREWEQQLAARGVSWLALDATPRKMVGTVRIHEFVEEIERRD